MNEKGRRKNIQKRENSFYSNDTNYIRRIYFYQIGKVFQCVNASVESDHRSDRSPAIFRLFIG
jgi:hypothetical protein